MKKIKDNLGFIVLMSAFVLSASFTFYNFISLNLQKVDTQNLKASVLESGDEVAFLGINEDVEEEKAFIHPKKGFCDPYCMTVLEEPSTDYLFEDMNEDHRFAYVVKKFYERGVVQGYEDGTFGPDLNLNRAEFLTVLVNVQDIDLAGQTLDNCFTDVTDEWYAPFVCYAKDAGWVTGYEDGSFRPGDDVLASEALKMAMEAFNYDTLAEADFEYMDIEDTSHWYMPYLYAASTKGIIADNGKVAMMEPISRGEFMQLLYNAMYFNGFLVD